MQPSGAFSRAEYDFSAKQAAILGKAGRPYGYKYGGTELSASAGDAADKKQKLPHRIFVRQLLLFGFDMYPQYWVSSIGGTYHFCLFLSLYSQQHFRCFQFV